MPGTLERLPETQLITLGSELAYTGDQSNCILLVKPDYTPTLSACGLNAATIRRNVTRTDNGIIRNVAFAFLCEQLAQTFIESYLARNSQGFAYPFPPEELKRHIQEPILLILERNSDGTWDYALNP